MVCFRGKWIGSIHFDDEIKADFTSHQYITTNGCCWYQYIGVYAGNHSGEQDDVRIKITEFLESPLWNYHNETGRSQFGNKIDFYSVKICLITYYTSPLLWGRLQQLCTLAPRCPENIERYCNRYNSPFQNRMLEFNTWFWIM